MISAGRRQYAEALAVLMKYDSYSEYSLPPILARDAAAFRRRRAFRRLGKAILVLTAAAVGSAALALEDPVAPLVAVSTSLTDMVASMSNQAMVRSAAAAPLARLADGDGLLRLATAAAAEPAEAGRDPTGDGSSGAVLKQFLAWADDQDAQARQQPAEPAKPAIAVQDVPTQMMADASEPVRVTPTPPPDVARILNARAELPPTKQDRAERSHAPQAAAKPVEATQAQDTPAPNAFPLSLMQRLGWHG
jgi:hypothetical protein